MIIKADDVDKTIRVDRLSQGEVFEYNSILYVRGPGLASRTAGGLLNDVYCTELVTGQRTVLAGEAKATHYPTATLTLKP